SRRPRPSASSPASSSRTRSSRSESLESETGLPPVTEGVPFFPWPGCPPPAGSSRPAGRSSSLLDLSARRSPMAELHKAEKLSEIESILGHEVDPEQVPGRLGELLGDPDEEVRAE